MLVQHPSKFVGMLSVWMQQLKQQDNTGSTDATATALEGFMNLRLSTAVSCVVVQATC
jgi:hypothetical protein